MSSLFLLLVLLLFRSYFRFAQGNARDYCPLGPFNDNTPLFSFHRDRCRRRQAGIKPRLLSFSVVVSSLFSIPCRPFLCHSLMILVLYCTVLYYASAAATSSSPSLWKKSSSLSLNYASAHTHTHTHTKGFQLKVESPSILLRSLFLIPGGGGLFFFYY